MRLRRQLAVGFTLVLLVITSGCTAAPMEYTDTGTAYTGTSVTSLLDDPPPAGLQDIAVSQAKEKRQAALVALRSQGGDAAQAADLITVVFAPDTNSVPYRVERASFDGKDALIVLEAVGPDDGTLSGARMWVLSADDGSVMLSLMR